MLTSSAIRNAKPKDKPYTLADGLGMILQVQPNGSKRWRFRYRQPDTGKAGMLSLGLYPDVSLKQACDRRDELRKLIADSIDPSARRKAKSLADESTFEALAREWHARFSGHLTPDHAQRVLRRMELDIFPWLGARPIAELKAPEILSCLRRIESRGALDTAHRALQNCSQVFRYAVATGQAEGDPTAALRGAIPPSRKKHFASIIDPEQIGHLLRAIDSYEGSFVVRCALLLAPLVFVRPGELRQAEWSEFNMEAEEWRIPAAKMKMSEQHIVPLSAQALAILHELQPVTGHGRYLFSSMRTADRPMSNNTVNASLRRLGYDKNTMTGHGFRSMASTLLNEQGWNRDAIEAQLAHGERDPVRGAYNFAQYLPERKKMMQHWADFLDHLSSDKVVPIRHQAGYAGYKGMKPPFTTGPGNPK